MLFIGQELHTYLNIAQHNIGFFQATVPENLNNLNININTMVPREIFDQLNNITPQTYDRIAEVFFANNERVKQIMIYLRDLL